MAACDRLVLSVLGLTRKWDVIFSINLKDTYFQIPVHLESRSYLWFVVEGKVYQFRALFQPFYSFSDLYQRVRYGFGVSSSKGDLTYSFLDDWLVIVESVPFLPQHREQFFQHCQDQGIVLNWEKSDLEPSSRLSILGCR